MTRRRETVLKASSVEGARGIAAGENRACSTAEERLGWVVEVFAAGRADSLLQGLPEGQAERAGAAARWLRGLESSKRQGWLAIEFGERQDCASALRLAVARLNVPAGSALLAELPGYLRALFRGATPSGEAPPPLARRVAARLRVESLRL